MDDQTLAAYQAEAPHHSARHLSAIPHQLYEFVHAFFHPHAATADVGCGSGRDVAWLTSEGYPTTGFDASAAMLDEARGGFPNLPFRHDSLPDLVTLSEGSFSNVLCSAVLMHLPREELITAVLNLARILREGGRIILSYRSSLATGEREADGRLYTAIETGRLVLLLEASGLQVLKRATTLDAGRPGITWTVIVAERRPALLSQGLERIQHVLAQDKKDATYKFALLRALCVISRTQPNLVTWGENSVRVPLWSIAVQWLTYYWPFLTGPTFVAQKRGEAPQSAKRIAFRGAVGELAETYGSSGLAALLRDLDENPLRYRGPLRRIADTIRYGPVAFSGSLHSPLFQHVPRRPADAKSPESQFGWVEVPESIWLEISRFHHWIEDSLILRWARLTAEMNEERQPGEFLPLLLANAVDERDTTGVRALLSSTGQPLQCVWTGNPITSSFEVDHLIPYAAWGNNDLWNLLPALPAVNNQKRDSLPSRRLLLKRRDSVVEYWRLYRDRRPHTFERQVGRALGSVERQSNWESIAFAGLQETVERVASTLGLGRWEP